MALRTGEIAVYDAWRVPEFGPRVWSRLLNARVTYARTRVDGRTVAMHRFVTGTQDLTRADRVCIDHEDHDGLNNTARNLRLGDYVTNGRNRRPNRNAASRFKGVFRNAHKRSKAKKPWEARYTVSGREIYIGIFATEEEGARAYDAAAREHFGEMAYCNFPGPTLPETVLDPERDHPNQKLLFGESTSDRKAS